MIRFLTQKWKNYKFRFVPWVAINMQNRLKESARIVPSKLCDPLIPPSNLLKQLSTVMPYFIGPTSKNRNLSTRTTSERNAKIMFQKLGFSIERAQSFLPGGGTGVFVNKGTAKKGQLVALYPGTIYRSFEPILLPSLNNPFIFRCLDGTHIDGKDWGLSKIIFKSCTGRDKVGPLEVADSTWLTKFPLNPLNIGQYVNNHTKEVPSNVAYQELDLPDDFDRLNREVRSLLPYINYGTSRPGLPRRVVALVATSDILEGTEVLSSYLTLVGS